MTTLPSLFSDWFAKRGWSIHPHQHAMLDRAEAPALMLIAPTGGGKTLAMAARQTSASAAKVSLSVG